MDLLSVLSDAGVSRTLLHTAGETGGLTGQQQKGETSAERVDGALG
jgi:hypothetical protein